MTKGGERIRPSLTAPFPFYGGKRRWADSVWARLGRVDVYVEPFAGSLALLLANPHPARRELVCDLNGHICNFWRAVAADPDAVAAAARWPTIHHDLTARHRRLVEWHRKNSDRLSEDAEWFDAEMAGWWVWGISSWIGGGWCADRAHTPDQVPSVDQKLGGAGVSAQRTPDSIPHVSIWMGGAGVSAQRATPPLVREWFRALSERLQRVVVLNRGWKSGLSRTMLSDTRTSPKGTVRAIVLDPPYLTGRRTMVDAYGPPDDGAAKDAWEWALANGERYRIVYFCHEGDFAPPAGWQRETMTFKGRKTELDRPGDCALFSPACLSPELAVSP